VLATNFSYNSDLLKRRKNKSDVANISNRGIT